MGCAPSSLARSSSRVSHSENIDGTALHLATTPPGVIGADSDGGGNDASVGKNGKLIFPKGLLCKEMFSTDVTPTERQPIAVLLVFPRSDTQCESFVRAAEAGHNEINIARSMDGAIQLFLVKRHSAVIVDTRPNALASGLDPEILGRSLRSAKNSECTVIIAIRPAVTKPGEETSILPLLQAGFNRQFVENTSVPVCLAELQTIEFGNRGCQAKLRNTEALLAAVDNSNDAIEITDENLQIQYVNSTYERLFGYHGDEIVGKNSRDLTSFDVNSRYDVIETMNAHLRKGSVWDGAYLMRRKNGDSLWQRCRMIPVVGHSGQIQHFVAIRNQTLRDRKSSPDITNGVITANGPIYGRHRQTSISRISSVNFDAAPITKVINMLGVMRDDSSPEMAASLDNVLEVLRSSELYAPHFTHPVREERVFNDFVDGLIKIDDEIKRTRKISVVKRGSVHSDVPLFVAKNYYQVSDEVNKLLESEATWNFNIIELEAKTNNSPLVHLAMKTLQRFDVLDFLCVDEMTMYNWLQLMESNYHAANPYHNSTHAADVMHATAYFLSSERLKSILDSVDEVAALLAAIVHDLDHPGKTNSYLVNSSSPLSLLYNDLDDYRQLRQQMVDMVLATEMTKHFEHLNRFVSVINQPLQPSDEDTLNSPSSGGPRASDERRLSISTKLSLPENKTLIKRMLIKCADVSNPARSLVLCKEWAERIAKEYCQQTEDEKEKGLPVVLPVFDRETCNVPKSQISFIDFFVNDMFDAWHMFCGVPEMMENINTNYAYWSDQEPIEASKIAKRLADKDSKGS